MALILHIRRERCSDASAQIEVQPEIAYDLFREQTDEIGISRQPRVIIGEDLLRSRRPADIIVLLQKQDTQSCATKITRGDEPVVAGAQDYDVVR